MNLLRSSRFKIVLVSVLTSTLVLLVFGGFAFWHMRANRLRTLDKELKDLGENLALFGRWNITENQLRDIIRQYLGEDRARGCIYAVQQSEAVSIRSAQWPPALNAQAHPHSTAVIEVDFGQRHRMPNPPPPPGEGGSPPGPSHTFGFQRGYVLSTDHDKSEPPPDPSHASPPKVRVFSGQIRSGGPAQFWVKMGDDDSPENFPPEWRPRPPTLYRPVISTVSASGRVFRLGVFGHAETKTVIHLGFDLRVFANDLNFLAHAFWLALPVAMMVIAAGAWLVARHSLAPVQRLSEEMENLSPAHLHSRLDASGADEEFQRIIQAYNAMLSRLERSFQQATRFSADASHELKTPLAVMCATLEKALSQSADGSSAQSTYASLLDETDHLQSIIEALLLLSRADAGKLTLSTEPLDFATWLRPLIEDAGLMAEARHLTVHEDLAATASIAADPVLLQRAVHNLLRNAVAYNHDGGSIWCSTRATPGHIRFLISNTGPAIPDTERERIFERFARGSNAGGTGQGRGLGIGLSLAREIVLAHEGTLDLTGNGPGSTTFVMTLPVSPG